MGFKKEDKSLGETLAAILVNFDAEDMEVLKKEIIKWLDTGAAYPIADSKWVSPVQRVPKKGGITVVPNAKNELIPTRIVTGWRVCMEYRKLNSVTYKDRFPIPFINQMLDQLVRRSYYCFLDGMPFGLCNALASFQRCMMLIFSNMVEDFSVVSDSCDDCLDHLGRRFLAMGRALTDLEKNEIKFRVNDEEITF
ncbi:uncharacterized protein LOC132607948 [Lycium barbarum]|uniref:uncharacterized protein LOC132607948 n=1 Tax=Lycium barbarum TaxID=112863 RepID=UPI00293F14D8|nr:uncharacterized protein LOC132607948 [Lycium barbarum]